MVNSARLAELLRDKDSRVGAAAVEEVSGIGAAVATPEILAHLTEYPARHIAETIWIWPLRNLRSSGVN